MLEWGRFIIIFEYSKKLQMIYSTVNHPIKTVIVSYL
jgi:hypothetical protein